jgi:hypothetical protein
MNLTTSHTIVPLADHPSRNDDTAQIVWTEFARRLPTVYAVRGGFLLTWGGSAVLELFATEGEAVSAWRGIAKEAL